MKCPSCGAEASVDSTYCASCGSKLLMKPSENAISPRIRARERSRSLLWLMLSVIGIAMVASGMFVWWYEVHGSHDDSADSQNPLNWIGEFTSTIFWALLSIAMVILGIIFVIAGLVLAVAAAFD